jgi:hypothetical protein
MVEGTVRIDCGPDQPKEGPLDSQVEHLVGVTGEEPAHRNYDCDLRKLTYSSPETDGKWKEMDLVGLENEDELESRTVTWGLSECCATNASGRRGGAVKLDTHAEDK